jgi:hypothetical protein
MSEPLEVTLKFGEKTHHLVIKDGDADAAAEAKQSVGFIIDLFAGSNEKKRQQSKAPAPVAPKAPLAPAATSNEKSAGGPK